MSVAGIPHRGGTTNNNIEHKNKQKPIIVIDGPNVACEYSGSRPGDARGVVATYRYWKEKGHNVAVFIKKHRLHNDRNPKVLLENVEELLKEIPKQSLTTVPAKEDDDSFMIEYCMPRKAVVVTNDQFKDHEEKYQGDEKKQFVEWRNNHRCGYAFALGEFLPSPDFEIQLIEAKDSKHSDKNQPKTTSKPIKPKPKPKPKTKTKPKTNKHDSKKSKTSQNTSKGTPKELMQWLEFELKDWKKLSALSQHIMDNFDCTNPKRYILETTGATGSVKKQLESIFQGRLEFKGTKGNTAARMIPAKVPVSKPVIKSKILSISWLAGLKKSLREKWSN